MVDHMFMSKGTFADWEFPTLCYLRLLSENLSHVLQEIIALAANPHLISGSNLNLIPDDA